MNDTEELLSQLRDLQLPPVSALPAPGWWLLGVGIVLLGVFAFFSYRRFQRYGWQRQARSELGVLRAQVGDVPVSQSLSALSKLVRRVALVARSRQSIASLHGEDWLRELDDICGREVFKNSFGKLLENGPYQKNPDVRDEDLHTLMDHVDELISAAAKTQSHGRPHAEHVA